MQFRPAFHVNGFLVLLGWFVLTVLFGGAAVLGFVAGARHGNALAVVGAVAAIVVVVVLLLLATGLTVVNPNEAKVVQFFGRYVGSVSEPGFFSVLPLTDRKSISLRVRNFETQKLKVNDADGNPVEIAAVVVYRVVDSFKAAFAVDDYEEYVETQSEAAVRHLATSHPYDAHEADRTSLRDGAEVAEELTVELRERTEMAGIEVLEARCWFASRPTRWSPRVPGSSRARSAWSAWRWSGSLRRAWWSSTRSARRPWCRTCSSCSAVTVRPSPSSTPVRSTPEAAPRG